MNNFNPITELKSIKWSQGYHQEENESIFQFLKRSYDELCDVVIDTNL